MRVLQIYYPQCLSVPTEVMKNITVLVLLIYSPNVLAWTQTLHVVMLKIVSPILNKGLNYAVKYTTNIRWVKTNEVNKHLWVNACSHSLLLTLTSLELAVPWRRSHNLTAPLLIGLLTVSLSWGWTRQVSETSSPSRSLVNSNSASNVWPQGSREKIDLSKSMKYSGAILCLCCTVGITFNCLTVPTVSLKGELND